MSKQIEEVMALVLEQMEDANGGILSTSQYAKVDEISEKLQEFLPSWQPIETAPQDEEFLGFKSGLGVVVACYLDEHHPDHDGCDFYIAWDLSPIRGLSHWMPIPNPPGAT